MRSTHDMPHERILTPRQQNALDEINERLAGKTEVCPYFSPVTNPIMGRRLDGTHPPEKDHMSVCSARVARLEEGDWSTLTFDNVGCVKSGMNGGVPRKAVFEEGFYKCCVYFPVAP